MPNTLAAARRRLARSLAPGLMSVLVAGCVGAGADADGGSTADTLTAAATDASLCDAINAYRAERGLPAVPRSAALMQVARLHVEDLNRADRGQGCNLHSWTAEDERWNGCCYTPDHAAASCMWDKPAEIAGYRGPGFEVAVGSNRPMTASAAVTLWHGSEHHRVVIANEAAWARKTWRGLGCAIEAGYAVAWVGEHADPE